MNWTRAGTRWPYLLLFVYVIGSNAYYSMATAPEAIRVGSSDAWNYWRIAEAAPHRPDKHLSFHQAQRFAVPAAVGIAAKSLGIPSDTMARVAVGLLLLAGLALTRRFLADRGASTTAAFFLAALVFLSPYGARVSLAVSFMLNDLTFVVGMVLALVGLARGSTPALLAGVVLAALARQTALALLVPLAFVAIVELRRRLRGWVLVLAAAGTLVIGIYALTAAVAGGISRPGSNLGLVLDTVTWLRESFSVGYLLELYGRGLTAHLVVLAVLLALLARRSAWRGRSTGDDAVLGWAYLLAGAAIIVQPLMITPRWTMGSLQRLTVLGHWPLVMGAYLLFRGRFEAFFATGPSRVALAALLAVYSQHHLFSWPGALLLRRPEIFVLVQALLAVATFVWIRHHERRHDRRGLVPVPATSD